jgi:excisionase family DNA binding protein
MKAIAARRAEETWFSPREAADEVRVGRRTIYRAISSGALKASMVNGRDLRIAASWLYAWLDRRTRP